ncbi:DNA repair protein RecN [Tumebacillus permanentifrigoris]|uniref:DNA repair protein RecN n=1 Tax=Tumebacillus permanentifrigoris TaxID=378543 RepID=A0A316DBL1_9BACL|nr:DNA repair protein RecN [Tumebacillus permanentifrigoris]PWK11546.1 DNA replication and repair protein RecN [Tumebacillus permanentifrigoris]
MLMELTVRNFALIEEVHLSLELGLNILTGETGAGKSILLDAVSLILGGRASSDLVRSGAAKATIEALFAVPVADEFRELCEEYGVDLEDDQVLVVRELSAAGKNVCRVNGRMVTVQMLKRFGQYLMSMHGQHEHQTLTDPREQLMLIDAFGGEGLLPLREQVVASFRDFREARQKLRAARLGEQERIQRLDIVRFQLQEILEAKPRLGEDTDLEEERKRLAYAEKLYAASNSSYEHLYSGAGRSSSALDQLNQTIIDLESVVRYDDTLAPTLELVKTALVHVEEAAHTLRDYRDEVEFNPNKLSQLDERLNVLRRLRKKYGDTVEEILAYQDKLVHDLEALENHEENLERLTQELERTGNVLAKNAVALSKARRVTSERLAKAVMHELGELMMPNTQFAISFTQIQEEDGLPIGERCVHVTEAGIDRVEFLFSPNVGESLRPLAKIASGGELSRTMLALKTLLADADQVGTLIFDEVDTGISGRAAQAVAEKLAVVSVKRQVICVTHLAQVSSMADTHYLIEKSMEDGRTRTAVYALDDEARVREVARMISGTELTETTVRHASEMLERARRFKR